MALSLALIEEAQAFLHDRIRRTPLEYSASLSSDLGVPVWLKLESLQHTGSFKIRGALFRLAKLTNRELASGIVTCSAGNHGKGIAYAARQLGIQATIYVPKSVDSVKYEGMLALGAEVIKSEFPGYDETEAWALEEAIRLNRPFISAFDDPYIMAANGGTIAAEILEDLPETRTLVTGVGGGGHAGGLAFYASHSPHPIDVICCQHEGCPALPLSLDQGAAVTEMPPIETVAGGLEGGLGVQTFAVLQDRIAHVALVSEPEIYAAVRWMLAEHQYLIEPSAAVPLAACLSGRLPIKKDGSLVLILTGRNVSYATLHTILTT